MVKLIQPSMAGGEVSPAIGARVDLAKRVVAVEEADNFIASFTGSMMSRPGSAFVAQCKPGAGPYRIIEFEFNDSQTFILELGDQYMRFHTAGAQVLDSSAVKNITAATRANPVVITSAGHGLTTGDEVYISGVAGMTQLNGRSFKVAGTTTDTFEIEALSGTPVNGTSYSTYIAGGTATPPYEIATPWAAADLFDVNYAQSGDVMTLVHPDYPPQELVRIDNDTWTLSEVRLVPGQAAPTDVRGRANTTVTSGTITGATAADPVVVTSASHGLATGDQVLIYGVAGMVELNNFLYDVTVLNANEFSIAYADTGVDVDGSGFTAYSSGGTWVKAIRPRQYTVTAINADDEEESLTGVCELPAGPGASIQISNITQADPCVVTTVGGHGFANLDEVHISGVVGMTELNDRRFQVSFISATSFSLRQLDSTPIDSTGLTAYVSGGTVKPTTFSVVASADSEWDNTIYWTPATGALFYNIYATDSQGVMGFVGTTSKAVFEDKNLGPDYAETPPRLYDPFDGLGDRTNKYPGSTGFFGQRRWFANSNNFPNRFWASQLGHFDNFSRSIPALSDDGIVASIAARRINDIKHIVPLTDLIFLTSGGEYRVTGEGGVITPSTINVKPQSYYGSTSLRPVVAGAVALFVSPGQFIRDLTYQFADDKFVGKDVTILARHLFDRCRILDWDYAPSPHALGFVVMARGCGLFLTYQPDQEVYAWTQAHTRGDYKSVAVVREGTYDVIYVLVERVISGETVTFLERFDERQFFDVQDAFCVDAGLTLDAPVSITQMSATSPVNVVAAGHGLVDGDVVDISGVYEASDTATTGKVLSTSYNASGLVVANATSDTFDLHNPAGTNFDGSAFAAYSSGGVVRKAVTTVSGLWHLEGATVVAAANGYVETGLVVSNGQITLSAPASRVHVGLPYTCRLKTLPLSTYSNGETVQGRAKNVNRLTVQVEHTKGMWYGPSDDLMREAKVGMPAAYGQPLPLVTQDIDVTMKADWAKRKQVIIEQRAPLPMTVLALIPDGQVGGN